MLMCLREQKPHMSTRYMSTHAYAKVWDCSGSRKCTGICTPTYMTKYAYSCAHVHVYAYEHVYVRVCLNF